MMHRQQTLSLLRSNSSRGSNNSSKRISNLSSTCSSTLSLISRRCLSNRSKSSSTAKPSPTTITPRCAATTTSTTSTTTQHSSSSSRPLLLSVLAWSVPLLLISSCLTSADTDVLMGHSLGKRFFMRIQCKGIYDVSMFAHLDRICEDCYNLFRAPTLDTLCKQNCFTSDFFKGCLDSLLLQDEEEQIKTEIKTLHGCDPGFG